MEKKVKKQRKESSKEQLVFVDKEHDCGECKKEKEIELSFGLSTQQEWETIMNLIEKYKLTKQEMDYVYGFYNREFKDKKRPGCGKCFVNVCRNLKNKWIRLNQGLTN